MAVITCKECGKIISDKAKSCPYCHKVQRANLFTRITGGWFTNMAAWQVVGIFVFIFLVVAVFSSYQEQPPKSPEEFRKERIEKKFSSWDGSHYGLTKLIKEAMNDPKSFEHVKTVYIDKGDYLKVKTTYRCKNAFGGIVKNWVWAKVDLEGNVIGIIEQGP